MLRWLESPHALSRIAVLLCVLVALVAAAVRFPSALLELDDLAERNAEQSFTDREIAGGNSVVPSQELMYQARARIGEDETYEVAVGEPVEGWSQLVGDHAEGYSRYFLMPRRSAPGAPWLLCFNCQLESNEGEIVWQDEKDGVALVRRAG